MSSTEPDTTEEEEVFEDTTEGFGSTPTGGTSSQPKTSSSAYEFTDDDEDDLTFTDILYQCYYNRYCWEIIKSVALFTLAIKMAQECQNLAIPMLEYVPFNSCP